MQKKSIVFDVEWVILNQTHCIEDTIEFIKKNHESYDFFVNTSMSKRRLIDAFEYFDIKKYFLELLAYEDGTKKEKVEYILQIYDICPEDLLFIDDSLIHIDAVQDTGVHTLLFSQDWVLLEEKITEIFN